MKVATIDFLLFHIIERKKKRERIYHYTEKKREKKNLPLTLEQGKKKKRRRKSFSSIKVFPLLPFSFFFSLFPPLKLSYTLAKIRCCWLAGKNFPFPKHESHALFPPFVSFSGKIHQHHFSTEALNWPV